MINFITLNLLNLFDFFHKKKIIHFLRKLGINDFKTVLDVGAHKGETLELFLKNFNIDRIISFEASEENYLILKKNSIILSKEYSQTKIIVENIALGSKNKLEKFKQFYESSSSTFSKINENSKYFKKKFRFLNKNENNNFFYEKNLKLVPLSEYLISNNINNIDILKIDTEGFELEVLNGLKEDIKKVDLIFFEHHYDNMILKNYKYCDINNLLKKNNFQKIYKLKMPFRKTFEYIYRNKENIKI
tara:strand:- start:6637 stop:7374 length:738 start_codon:yes stop_codon:yes gene_type:complete